MQLVEKMYRYKSIAPATCVERHALMHHELVMYTKPIISWLKTINIIIMIMQPNGFVGDSGGEKISANKNKMK